MSTRSSLAIYLFGSPRIEQNGRFVQFNTRKATALLAYLAVTPTWCQRDTLTGLLWPELPQSRAKAALRSTLSVIKKELGDAWLLVVGDQVCLESGYMCDVSQFRQFVTQTTTAALTQAVALYQNDFMAGFYLRDSARFDEWRLLQDESLHRDMDAALDQLVTDHVQQQQWETAVTYARRRLQIDPLHEPAHQQILQVYLTTNQRTAALRHYQQLRDLLAEELGTTPSTKIKALMQRIQSPFAAANPTPFRTNLPNHYPLTPFVGRQVEIAHIQQHLQNATCRLLTITGAGGMGKTRLGLEVGQRSFMANLFQGVYFVPLAAVSHADYLVTAVAQALNFTFYGQELHETQLGNYLHEKQYLLILDNVEHLLPISHFIQDLLRQASHLKLLVTSREQLHLREEWVLPLQGLPYPRQPAAAPTTPTDALHLFYQQARRLDARFDSITAEPHVIKICRLLEGMPLGIELAAAWVPLLSCAEIAQEIALSLDFLQSRFHDLPPRHLSLRAVFMHSWQLLSPTEQETCARLTVFRGGFSREAAAAVCDATLPMLATLADKSLLQRQPFGRFAIPEALRQYAAEQLADETTFHTAHALYFTQFLADHTAALRGNGQVAAVANIGRELENVRAAWHWAVSQSHETALAAGMEALFRFYEMRSLFVEGAAAFAAITSTTSPLLYARAQARYGRFCQRLGQLELAQQLLQQSLEIAQAHQSITDTAFAQNNLGYIAWSQSDYPLARSHYQASLVLYRQLGDAAGCAQVLNNLAILPQDTASTAALLQESLQLTQQVGDLWGAARVLNNLGIVTTNSDEAWQRYEACIDICRNIGDRFLLTHPLINLGHEQRRRGEFAAAHEFYTESLAICQDIGYRRGMGRCLAHLAAAAHSQGDDEAAGRYSQEGLALAQAVGDQRGLGLLWYTLGVVALDREERETAVSHFQHSLTTFRAAADSQGEAWPLLGLSRCALAYGQFTAAREQGQTCLDIFYQVHDSMGTAQAHVVLAEVAIATNDMSTARVYLQKALDTAVTTQTVYLIYTVLLGIAQWHTHQHDMHQAAQIACFVQQQSTATATDRTRAVRLAQTVRTTNTPITVPTLATLLKTIWTI